MTWQLRVYQELMNVKLDLDMEITTSCWRARRAGWSLGWRTWVSIPRPPVATQVGWAPFTRTSTAAWQGSGSFSHSSSTFSKMVVVKKIEFCDGKLVSESSGVLPKWTTTAVPPVLWAHRKGAVQGGRKHRTPAWGSAPGLSSPLVGAVYCLGTNSYLFPQLKAKSSVFPQNKVSAHYIYSCYYYTYFKDEEVET